MGTIPQVIRRRPTLLRDSRSHRIHPVTQKRLDRRHRPEIAGAVRRDLGYQIVPQPKTNGGRSRLFMKSTPDRRRMRFHRHPRVQLRSHPHFLLRITTPTLLEHPPQRVISLHPYCPHHRAHRLNGIAIPRYRTQVEARLHRDSLRETTEFARSAQVPICPTILATTKDLHYDRARRSTTFRDELQARYLAIKTAYRRMGVEVGIHLYREDSRLHLALLTGEL